jgi:hypothetical protein
MSLPKKDRKVRSKIGKTFPAPRAPTNDLRFCEAISEALRREYGGSPAAVKMVVRLTRTNERAVRNWFAAKNGPSGENLVILLRHSEEVLQTVLFLAGRHDLITARKLTGAREKLHEMLSLLDDLQPRS